MRRGEMQYRTFTPNVAVRWDALSHAMYGTPWLEEILQFANPDVLGRPWVQAGTALVVPILERRPWVDPNSLPPWDSRRMEWRR
jgi:hypothetical protein